MTELRIDKDDKNVPTLNDYRMNRANKEAMKVFVTRFLSHVIGRTAFRKKQHVMLVRDMATVGDEAFTLLMLGNHWEYWAKHSMMDYMQEKMAANRRRDEAEDVQRERKRKEREEKMGKWTMNKREAKRFRGWSKEGIKAFNDYGEMVKKTREEHPEFDNEYLVQWQKEFEEKKGKKKRVANDDRKEMVEAFDDFN